MKQYIDLLKHVVEHGDTRVDRTGVGTKSVFGYQMRFNLQDGFPAVTTKQLAWRAMYSELLWFLEGSTDERRLCEILHGTRDASKSTIWTANANADYWRDKAAFPGDCGRIYGKQMRTWENYKGETIDQIQGIIDGLIADPYSRRHLVINYNPGEVSEQSLPACHTMSQFYVDSKGRLSCQLYARSQDIPLGTPFNIASYSLLTHMIAQVCGLDVGEYIHTIGDAHIYLNQMDGVLEQINRVPGELPKLWLNPDVTTIDGFGIDDAKLVGYTPQPQIKYAFAT